MLQKKYSFNYSKVSLLALGFLYFVIPIGLQHLVGEEFYIFSKYQFEVSFSSIWFYGLLILVIYLLVSNINVETYVSLKPPQKNILLAIIFANTIYLFIILIKGFLYNAQGIERIELLRLISSQLVPGYGYLLLLACIAIIQLKSNRVLFVFLIISFSIDLVYQGKIFATVSLMLGMFYMDNRNVNFSYRRVFLLGISGFGFLVLIFIIRALSSSDQSSDFVNVYTSFSEFMGVNATTGWGFEYYKMNFPSSFTNFDSILQNYYMGSVGHGLALSPVAYFLGNFGEWYLVATLVYLTITYLTFYLAAKIIGRFSIFVFMYNFIHLLRHGPDLFLTKSISHIIFLIIVLYFIKSFHFNKADQTVV